MRKVLLSFLGLSEYKACYYSYEGKKSTYTRFVQTAIYEHLENNDALDIVYVFVTKEARKKNWDDSISNRSKEPLEGLRSTFERIAPLAKIELVEISGSQDNEANWQIFDSILAQIEDSDEIYFDMTHSFRSIPLVALIVLNYARMIKRAKIGRLMYGNFEALGPVYKIDEIPPEERIAPIVDVTNMVSLLDWTNGVDQFMRSGNASLINELTETETGPILRSKTTSKLEKDQVIPLKGLAKQLDNVGRGFQTARSLSISDEINLLREKLAKVRDDSSLKRVKPLVPLLNEIESKYSNFSDNKIINLFEQAKWCEENDLIQPGFTLLQENCVTAICHVLNLDEKAEKVRTDIHSAIHALLKKWPKHTWKVQDKALVEKVINFLTPYRDILKPFDKITSYRNDINHAGAKPNPVRLENLYRSLRTEIENLRPFFMEMSEVMKQKAL